MIDESILKSNFIGRDGFRWWIGQIPPIGAQKTQANGGGWGNRTKVRILGYHPYSTAELSNDDLPWAQVLLSPTSGSGAANYAVNSKLRPGDTVLGFFLDGDNAQIPVIIGCFGRTKQVPSTTFKSPFIPFTGYTQNIPAPNGTLYKSEENEENSSAQKSPRDVTPEQISNLNAQNLKNDEVFYFSGVGKKVVIGNSSSDTMASGIGSEINNILQKISDITNKIQNIKSEIGRSVAKIAGIATGFVADSVNSVYKKLIELLKQGLKKLFDAVKAATLAATANPAAAHLAGVAAQAAMRFAVKALESYIPKIIGIVSNNLVKVVEKMLTDVVSNVDKFTSSIADQFVGSLLNDIVGKIERGLSGVLGGVSKILSSAFSVSQFLRSGVSAIKAVGGLFDINQNKNKSVSSVAEYTIGIGINRAASEVTKFENILKNMNDANAIVSMRSG